MVEFEYFLKKQFLCLDTCKGNKEWYWVECERVIKNPKLVLIWMHTSTKLSVIPYEVRKLWICNSFETPWNSYFWTWTLITGLNMVPNVHKTPHLILSVSFAINNKPLAPLDLPLHVVTMSTQLPLVTPFLLVQIHLQNGLHLRACGQNQMMSNGVSRC